MNGPVADVLDRGMSVMAGSAPLFESTPTLLVKNVDPLGAVNRQLSRIPGANRLNRILPKVVV